MSGERIHVYELYEPLERGGLGGGFRARVVETGGPLPPGTEVQFRLLDVDDVGGDEAVAELVKAHGRARAIDSPAVLSPRDFGVTTGDSGQRFWSAAPWVEGQVLTQLLDEVGAFPDALSEATALGLAVALRDVHSAGLMGVGLVAEAVLVLRDSSVMLIDAALGGLRVARVDGTKPGGAPLSSVAPELLRADKDPSAKSDLYALGALLYRCIVGQEYQVGGAKDDSELTPTEAVSRRPNDVRHDSSIFLSEVVHTLLDPDPTGRFASATALVNVLHERRDSEWWRSRNIMQETFVGTLPPSEVGGADAEPDPPPIPPPAAPPADTWFEERQAREGSLAPHQSSCIGRDDIVRRIVDSVFDLAEDGGRVLLIEAPGGLGKTRLIDAAMARLRTIRGEDAPVLLVGEHRCAGIGRPLQAFSAALTGWLGAGREVTTEDVATLLGDATGVAPAFAAFLSGLPAVAERGPLTRESLASAFALSLKTLCLHRPLVFVVHNLQWADPEGLDLFGYLARLTESLPVLMVGTYRPVPERSPAGGLIASLAGQEHVETIQLGPLGAADVRLMLAELMEIESEAAALAPRMFESSGGSPEMVEETLRLLEAEGQLSRGSDGRLVCAADFDDMQLPGNLVDLVDRRLAVLGEGERNVLTLAAVQGIAFDLEVVRLALGVSSEMGDASIRKLADGHFVWGAGVAWRFASTAVFERVNAGIREGEFERRHELTADAFLASRNPDQLPPSELHGVLCYRVAWHYLLAGRRTRGLLYVSTALRHLRDTWRIGDAERLADLACRALEADGRHGELIDMLRERAECLALQGRRLEQREVLADALQRASAQNDTAREAQVLLDSAKLRLVMGAVHEAREEGRQTLRLANRAGNTRVEARCHSLLGTVAFREARYQEARTHMQRVLDLSRQIRDEEAEALALQTLGTISQGVGSWDHAEELQRAAMSIYRRSGDLAHEAEVLMNLGTVAAKTGDPVRGEQYLRRALAIHRSLGDGYSEARVLGHLGMLLLESRRLGDARSVHQACLRVSREMGAKQDELASLVNLATTEYLLGQLEAARDHYGDALRAGREVQNERLIGFALTGLAEISRQRGELDISRGLMERAVTQLHRSGDPGAYSGALLAAGRLETMLGDPALARQTLDRAIESASEPRAPVVTALALVYVALLAAREQNASEAEARLAEAERSMVGQTVNDLTRVELLFMESLVLRVLGRRPHADAKLMEADTLLREFTEGLRDDFAASLLTNVSPHREIVAGAAAVRAAAAVTPDAAASPGK